MNNKQHEEEVFSALPTDDRPIRFIGMVVLLSTLGVFGIWSIFAPMDASALAPGTVAVKSHRKTVQHLDGGIVKTLIAKDGDKVKAGDPLLILDDTQIKAQLEIVKGEMITLLTQGARLLAERDGASEIVYSDRLKEINDSRTEALKESQKQIFIARRHTHQGGISVLKQRISQLKAQNKGLRGQQLSKKQLQASYQEEILDLRELLAEGYADKLRLRDIERNLAIAIGEIAELESAIAGNKIQVGETQLQIMQLKKQFMEDVVSKLDEVQNQLNDAAERLMAAQDQMDRTVIKAPVQGTVLGLSVHTEGGVIEAGTPILDIVPENEELVVNARVNPLDIDRVSTGLTAEVRFNVFKQKFTPTVEGKVINLSADSLVDDKTGVSYYQARIELTPESYRKLAGLQLLPGMPAEVLINTGERTLLEYLLQPITDAFARALIED